MNHFHVFVRQEGGTTLRVFVRDLAEEEVKHRIVRPYRRGTSIVHGGKIIPIESLRELRICMTNDTFEQAYSSEHAAHCRAMEELNRDSGVLVLSVGPGHDDMADSFEDVTDQFLRGKEPGDAGRPSLFAAITNHPVVSAVLGGVVLAGLTFYLGWN